MSELPPGVRECSALITGVQADCLLHGLELPHRKLLLRMAEQFVRQTEKNDDGVYLRFLEDVYPIADQCEDRELMTLLLSELTNLLRDETVGRTEDRALLLDYHSWLEPEEEKRVAMLKQALSLVPEVRADNALLISNLRGNLGALYRARGDLPAAEAQMRTAMETLMHYGLVDGHDSLIQCLNYAALLFDDGRQAEAVQVVESLREHLETTAEGTSSNLALLMETLGSMYAAMGEEESAVAYLRLAMRLYAALWMDEPERIAAKAEELETYLRQPNL